MYAMDLASEMVPACSKEKDDDIREGGIKEETADDVKETTPELEDALVNLFHGQLLSFQHVFEFIF